MQAATRRWQARTPLRAKKMEAIAQGRFGIADSKERVTARVNPLLAQLPGGDEHLFEKDTAVVLLRSASDIVVHRHRADLATHR